MKEKKRVNINFLRTLSLVVAAAGAIGSLYFMFSVSGKQNSIILLGLFTAWVLSPFIGLFISNTISNRWTAPGRKLLYCLIIVLTIGSLVAYGGAFTAPEMKPAFIFLVVPLISWVLIVTVFLIAIKISHKSSDTNQT